MPAQVGTIISGTLRSQDLLPAFLDALRELHVEAYIQVTTCSPWGCPPSHAQEDEEAEWWGEEADWVLQSLTDALNECAPDGCYFGAHWGDGADFGFWPHEES